MRLNDLAIVGAVLAILGLVLIVVAYAMTGVVTDEYLTTDMTDQEFLDSLGTLDDMMILGMVVSGFAIVVVAFSVPAITSRSYDRMRSKLEKDFYRRCPRCGSWSPKLDTFCQTCGIQISSLPETPVASSTSSPADEHPR